MTRATLLLVGLVACGGELLKQNNGVNGAGSSSVELSAADAPATTGGLFMSAASAGAVSGAMGGAVSGATGGTSSKGSASTDSSGTTGNSTTGAISGSAAASTSGAPIGATSGSGATAVAATSGSGVASGSGAGSVGASGNGSGGGSTSGAPPVCSVAPNTPCATSCGSTGTEACEANVIVCVPPAETCNLMDDDCSGYCDDIAGCRVGVDRSFTANGYNYYTTSDAAAQCCGNAVQQYDNYYLYASSQAGLLPFYECAVSTGAFFSSTDSTCGGYINLGQMGWIAQGSVCGAVPLYELGASSGDFFYTTDQSTLSAVEGLGYFYIGIVGYVWQGACGSPSCP